MTLELVYGITVSLVAFFPAFDELACKVLDIGRKIIHNCFFSVRCLGMYMVDGTIGLAAPVGCGLADEAISTIPTDCMEHRKVVCT